MLYDAGALTSCCNPWPACVSGPWRIIMASHMFACVVRMSLNYVISIPANDPNSLLPMPPICTVGVLAATELGATILRQV